MKYFLIAGERSGDLHASNLMKQLCKLDEKADFKYIGGDYMQEVGGEMIAHYDILAFMGIWDVLINLRTISRYLKLCKEQMRSWSPDTMILIDYAGFNLKIAKMANTLGIKVCYYISPKVWAWNSKRAYRLKKYVDHMFVILPFEKKFYKQFEWDVEYVGNPVVDAVRSHSVDREFQKRYLPEKERLVAVLPGSRKQEIKLMLPLMVQLMKNFPQYQFLVAGVGTLPSAMYDLEGADNAELIMDKTYDILSVAKAAMVTSGTATLETGLLHVPQVVGYKTYPLTYAIGSRVVNIKYFSLVNLIVDKPIVKELLQSNCTVKTLSEELKSMMENKIRIKEINEGYQELNEILGETSASKNTAQRIITQLRAQ